MAYQAVAGWTGSPYGKGMTTYAGMGLSPLAGKAMSPYAGKAVSPYAGKAVSPYAGKAMTPYAGKGLTPTMGGACSSVYAPVANVCQSSVPVTQMVPVTQSVPVTTVTPVPSAVAPQVAYGQPVTTSVGAPITTGVGVSPWGMGKPLSAGGISSMSASQSKWGSAMRSTTGVVPGVYTSEVALPMIW